jgi:DNA-binding response OmpR family regulator
MFESRGDVLVVVRRARVRDAIAGFWHEAAFPVIATRDTKEARERLLRRPPPVLVVLDLTSASGRSLHRWLLARAALRQLPVAALVEHREKVPGVFASIAHPTRLAPWLRVYERLRGRLGVKALAA